MVKQSSYTKLEQSAVGNNLDEVMDLVQLYFGGEVARRMLLSKRAKFNAAEAARLHKAGVATVD
ncbi:MAG: hypothetical protein NVS9B14_19910 [Candidatus Acidiferrum sp.]